MRLLQLRGAGSAGHPIDLHPCLTVVTGASEDEREQLVAALAGLPHGEARSGEGFIEAHGVVFDLDPQSLRLLDLDPDLDVDLDVVVRAEDLRAVAAVPAVGVDEFSAAALADARRAHRQTQASHDALRVELEALKAKHDELASAAMPEVEGSEAETVQARHDQIQAALTAADAPDLVPVQTALAGLAPEPVAQPVPQAVELADEFDALTARLHTREAELESAGLGPIGAGERLDRAHGRLAELEVKHAPKSVSQDDQAALEAAHDAVVDAEQRVSTTRFGGRTAERKLEELVEAEAGVLARVGFPTYSAAVMYQAAPTPDIEARSELNAAHADMAAADVAYAEVLAGFDADGDRHQTLDQIETISAAAASFLGDSVSDVAAGLRAVTAVPEDDLRAWESTLADLKSVLEAAGVAIHELDLTGSEIAQVASVWLAEMTEAGANRREMETELTELGADLNRLGREAVADGSGLDTQRVVDTRAAESQDRISAQEVLMAVLCEAVSATAMRLAETEEAAGASPAGPDGSQAEADDSLDVEQVEWYLLTRMAAHENVSYAGSVPLVLDGALAGLDSHEIDHLLDRIGPLTTGLQVIYVGDHPDVVAWARKAGDIRAAVADLS